MNKLEEMRADERLGTLKEHLPELTKEIKQVFQDKTLTERMGRLEYYTTVMGTVLAGPMVTPSNVRSLVRDELQAWTKETQHNQEAYHAVVNEAYVRSRQLLDLVHYIIDLLKASGVEIDPEFYDNLEQIDKDYQETINKAIKLAIERKEILPITVKEPSEELDDAVLRKV